MKPPPDLLLNVTGLTKRFSVTVLDGCPLQIRAGEIHALLGANGAGKSTLCRIIAGLLPPTSGSMTLAGAPYAPANKRAAEAAGVQIVQQELNLIPTLSVAENLFLTRLPSRWGYIRQQELRQRARQTLDRLGLKEIDADRLVGSLGVGHQQMIEIAAALDRDCKLLILDEPTAALSAAEAETLFDWLQRLRQQGTGIIYISHRLDEVAQLADRLTVLRDGKYVGTYSAVDLTTDEMVDLMSGDASAKQASESPALPARCPQGDSEKQLALRVENLSCGIVRDVSFTVHQGERLGIFGLVGSGRTELLRAIFGADCAESGQVFLGDEPMPHRFRHPSEAVRRGLAMVTEDRKQNGVLLTQSIRVNTTLSSLWKLFAWAGIVRQKAETHAVAAMCESLDVRCTGMEQAVASLSGGNQQKVAVAKWLTRGADVFLFDEPTRGIDVAARRRIYTLLESLAAEGKGIVIVSSDLEELLQTCDRIAVMSGGRLVATFKSADWSHERLMQAAFSGYMASSAVDRADELSH